LTEIEGKLLKISLVEQRYQALIERTDVETVVMNKRVELRINPSTVDKILAVHGEGQVFRFAVKDGMVVEAQLLSEQR
jgi:hypothetical protein